MKFLKLLLPILLALFPQHIYAAAVIFNGNEVKALKPNLNLFDQAKILTGSNDPSAVATDAPRGSLYLRTLTGDVYRKTDAGSTTNWTRMANGVTTLNSLSGAVTLVAGTNVSINDNGIDEIEISATGGGGGGGDISGPGAATTDNAITRWNGTSGLLIQNSVVTVGDTGNVAGINDLAVSGDTTLDTSLTGVLKATSGLVSAGALVNADVSASAAIDATKIADGSVTSTEFQYINTLSSNAQTQLNAKPNTATLSDNRLIRGDGTAAIQASGITVSDADEISNALIDADSNTVTNIENADIKAGAAIARNKLASGSNSHVVINDGSGVLSSEATLAKSRGGSGQDNSSLTFPASGTLSTLAGSETLSNKSATNIVLNGTLTGTAIVDEDDMISDSATKVPTQQSVRAFVYANAGGFGAIQTKTGAYTALISDGLILCSGSSFSVTLYTAVGNAGREITIKKTDSSVSNLITVDADGTETIDGALTFVLSGLNQTLRLVSDGANWQILEFDPAGQYLTATSSTFLGSTSGFVSNEFAQMTGNYIDLPPGSWVVNGLFNCGNGGVSPGYTQLSTVWSTVNGNNTTTVPTFFTVDAGYQNTTIATLASTMIAPVIPVRVTVSTTTRIYLTVRISASAVTNAEVIAILYAERLKR